MMCRATATVATSSSSSASGMPRIAVSGLARKFWMISSWMPWYARDDAAQREQRLGALLVRLADADEDARW